MTSSSLTLMMRSAIQSGVRQLGTIAMILAIATLPLSMTSSALAHPGHHDERPTQPSLLRVLPQQDGELTLLVRHLRDDRATRAAQTMLVGTPDNPTRFSNHAHAEPAMFTGGGSEVHLLIDNSLEVLDSDADCVVREGLKSAIRRSFTPGDRIAIHFLDSIDEPERNLAVSANLDEILGFIDQRLDGNAPHAGRVRLTPLLDRLARDREPALHRELVWVINDQAELVEPLDELEGGLRRIGVTMSALALRADEPGALCGLASRLGGLCRRVPAERERVSEGLLGMMTAVRSVFVSFVPCLNDVTDSHVDVLVQTPSRASSPVRVDADIVACAECDDDPECADAVALTPRSEEPEVSGSGWLWFIILLTLATVGFVAAFRLRGGASGGNPATQKLNKKQLREDLAEGVTMAARPLNRSALAVQEEDKGMLASPTWRRAPSLEEDRRTLRSSTSTLEGPHLAAIMDSALLEVPLANADVATLGGSGDVPTDGLSEPIARVRRSGGALDLDGDEDDGRITLNGETVRRGRLRPGDELVLDGSRLVEVRDGSARSAKEWSLKVEPAGAFDVRRVRVGAISCVIGRDPIPLPEIEALPTARRIDELSNDHVELWSSGGFLYTRDLGSSNGSFLNGRRIAPWAVHRLTHGDQLSLSGLVRFEVE